MFVSTLNGSTNRRALDSPIQLDQRAADVFVFGADRPFLSHIEQEIPDTRSLPFGIR